MTGETIKALLMIAMFGLFEALLNVPRIQRLRQSLHRTLSEFWRSLALAPRALQPVKAKARAKQRNI